ncbi:MAG: hypothetical protein C0429_16735 [Sphingopyxis sp.]|nr:hypothetical protein [Sphingopyxis sp.]
MIMAIVALFVLSTPATASTKAWQISESTGAVSVESNGQVRTGARGMSLKAGDAVSTGSTGRAVIVRGGEYVIVSPKSRVRITKPEETGAITQIFQSIGSALFKIEKKETPHFGVKTPYLAAVVKGTTFNVTVTANGATVQVTEGRVEVSTLDGGASDMIVPGRIGRVDANDLKLLKVMGNEAAGIRSSSASVISPANEKSATEAEATGKQDDESKSTSDSVSKSDNAGAASATADSNSKSEFSGKIAAPIASDPVSLALVTGGLISGNQGVIRDANVTGRSGSAAADSKTNVGGNAGDAAVGAVSGSWGNGNGDAAGGNSDTAGGNAGGNSDAAGGNSDAAGGNAGGNSDAAGGNSDAAGGNAGGNSDAAGGNSDAAGGNAGGNSDAAGGNAGGNADAAGGKADGAPKGGKDGGKPPRA